ncbi:MAG TPA: hypothetical protein VFE34_09740 [Dongiaceae bacterium]|nr:hypothetical protein [Dongiaceae bacterium]
MVVLDAEAAPKPCAVPREAIFDLGARCPQFLAQLRDVRAEMHEVHRNREVSFRAHKEARRLPVEFLHPEDLR